MVLNRREDMYNKHAGPNNEMNNRLFATFTHPQDLDGFIQNLVTSYDIMNNKIFILQIKGNDNEYVCTYNTDSGNIDEIPDNTILVHRKKETNTLYSLNGLNEIIKSLNSGVVDVKFPITWNHYRNSIILTQRDELKILKTKIFKIIEL